MKEMICIVCPNGCRMCAEEKDGCIVVTGNRCKRGEAFARAELKAPMRTICSTAPTVYKDVPVIPVRVSGEIPKSKIFDVMRAINAVTVKAPVKRGEAVIRDVLGLGVDIIVTSNLLFEKYGQTACKGVGSDE